MPFILSSSTTVSAPFQKAVSVNASLNTLRQDLFQLSNSNPIYDTLISFQTTLSITIYAPGPLHSTVHSVNCEEANSIPVQVIPGFCGGPIPGLSLNDNYYVTSYSYNKDKNGYGTETWNLVTANQFLDEDLNVEYEILFFRGVATGNSTNPESQTGVQFEGNTIQTKNFSVSVGFPGIGTANISKYGRVTAVGGGTGPGGTEGQASVSIPYIPVPTDSTRKKP